MLSLFVISAWSSSLLSESFLRILCIREVLQICILWRDCYKVYSCYVIFFICFMFSFITGKSKRGELSIFPKSFTVLSHCLHMMPRQKVAPGSDNAKVSNIFSPFPLLCLVTWCFLFFLCYKYFTES